jgi:hypothetical protein
MVHGGSENIQQNYQSDSPARAEAKTINSYANSVRCSTPFQAPVEVVEDRSTVEDATRGSAGLMRVGTNIAHKAHGFHRAFEMLCGSSGKRGWSERPRSLVFQMSCNAPAGFRNPGRGRTSTAATTWATFPLFRQHYGYYWLFY